MRLGVADVFFSDVFSRALTTHVMSTQISEAGMQSWLGSKIAVMRSDGASISHPTVWASAELLFFLITFGQ